MIGDGGVSAEHKSGKQSNDGKRSFIDDSADAEKSDNQTDKGAENDRYQKTQALSESAEQVAEGKQELFVKTEDDGNSRSADTGDDDCQSDKGAE